MLWWITLLGCIQELQQNAGTGSVYTTRCTAEMEPRGTAWEAACTPPTCLKGYTSASIGHAAVALEPGKRLIGVAERACVQDLSHAAALFAAEALDGASGAGGAAP